MLNQSFNLYLATDKFRYSDFLSMGYVFNQVKLLGNIMCQQLLRFPFKNNSCSRLSI
jgi:hypothetical protein